MAAFWDGVRSRTGWVSQNGCVPKRVGRPRTGSSQNGLGVSKRVRLKTPHTRRDAAVSTLNARPTTRLFQHSRRRVPIYYAPLRGQPTRRRSSATVCAIAARPRPQHVSPACRRPSLARRPRLSALQGRPVPNRVASPRRHAPGPRARRAPVSARPLLPLASSQAAPRRLLEQAPAGRGKGERDARWRVVQRDAERWARGSAAGSA